MKALFSLTLLLFTMAVSADSIKLMEYKYDRDVEIYRTTFRVNKPLNRAWVEITFSDFSFNELHYSDRDIKVPGLAYDPEINGVVYNNKDEKIVCGTFYNARWVIDRGMSFRDSGRCKIETRRVSRSIDDGFYIREVEMVEVFLNII